MPKPGVVFYFDVRPCIKRLTLEEKGRLFEAILDYAEFGIVPDVDGSVGVAWDFIQPKIDRDGERYDRQVEQKQFAAFSREMKKNGSEPISFSAWKTLSDNERHRLITADNERHPTNNLQSANHNLQTATSKDNIMDLADKPPSHTKFSPPSLEEIKQYCKEQGFQINPEQFFDYYTANGWKVGKNPMKDWKATVRNWTRKVDKNERTSTNEFSSLGPIGTVV